MDKVTVRLELLKLTFHHGRDAAEAVEKAKVLESYLNSSPSSGANPSPTGSLEAKAPAPRGMGKKRS